MRRFILGFALCAFAAAPAMACGPDGKDGVPPLAAAIDRLLPKAELAGADREQVVALREQIRQLMAAGRERAAREPEEQAMRILGYKKAWLRCGPGTFRWMEAKPRTTSRAAHNALAFNSLASAFHLSP
jgi:hypothetical protein